MIVPIENPNRGFRVWRIDELYTGPTGGGVNVPSVGDAVLSWETEMWQRVTSVDPVTKLSTLGPAKNIPFSGVDDKDIFIGSGGGHISETYRLNVDKSVIPHRVQFDARMRVYGNNYTGVRLFDGIDTSKETGKVISAYYNQSGQFVSDVIPLETVLKETDDNSAIKAPLAGNVNRDLKNGGLVTAVVYGKAGAPAQETRLLARDNTFVFSLATTTKSIVSLRLKSNFLSPTDDRTLLYPVNVPVDDIEVTAVLTYSDDTTREVAVNGSKVSLHGTENFISTLAGQPIPISLTYLLDDDEESTIAKGGARRHITETFRIVSIPMKGAYSVKLFVCPHWIDAATGYQLRYYLFNLDGTRRMDVTSHVQVPEGAPTYLPKAYGTLQQLRVVLELNDAVPGLGAYRHVQPFAITLHSAAHESGTPWTVNYNPGLPEVYGVGLSANISIGQDSSTSIDLRNGLGSQAEWLTRLYEDTKPLYGGQAIPAPRKPTHYEVLINGQTTRKPISTWDEMFELNDGINVKVGDTLLIRWVLATPTNDVWLAISALVVKDETDT